MIRGHVGRGGGYSDNVRSGFCHGVAFSKQFRVAMVDPPLQVTSQKQMPTPERGTAPFIQWSLDVGVVLQIVRLALCRNVEDRPGISEALTEGPVEYPHSSNPV